MGKEKPYWLSWVCRPDMGNFILETPWWVSGQSEHGDHICAAVLAVDKEAAKRKIIESYETTPCSIEWRFCNEKPIGWAPFCERFPRAGWMVWPAIQSVGSVCFINGEKTTLIKGVKFVDLPTAQGTA